MKFPLGKIIALFFLFSVFSIQAQDCIPEKPSSYPFMVYDNTNSLSPQEVQNLENELEKFSRETSNQIVVVFLSDLCGYSAADFGTELGQRWGVGKEKEDNGIVILVKPTGEKKERTAAIAIGRGLEPVISDGTAGSILRNEMIPNFKNGNYYMGVVSALKILEPLAKKEFNQADYEKRSSGGSIGVIFLIVLAAIFIIGFKFVQARSYSQTNHTSFWTALMLMSFMNSGRGSWNDFHSGRGGFGGGSGGGGGGFGGFGGGSFGGGGSESSW